jgi:hypothetical protein
VKWRLLALAAMLGAWALESRIRLLATLCELVRRLPANVPVWYYLWSNFRKWMTT